MAVEKNYYNILEVSVNADSNEIKKSYRKLARKFHPDTNQGNKEAEFKFKEISEAYEILSNEGKKQEYDNRIKDANKTTKVHSAAKTNQGKASSKVTNMDKNKVNSTFTEFFGFKADIKISK